MDESEVRKMHHSLDFVGLRAHATAVGLVQLTIELERAGVLDRAAVGRVKDSIASEISLGRPRSHAREVYKADIRKRLDRVFAGEQPVGELPLADG